MGFFWIYLYGLTHTVSRYVPDPFHLPNGMTAPAMMLYLLALLLWLLRTGRGLLIGLHRPARLASTEIIRLFPLLVLPVCNLLHTKQPFASWDTLVILLCAAVAEELLFRGWLLTRLLSRPITAVCLTSAVFALLHTVNFSNTASLQPVLLQMLCAFCFGLSCGAVTLRLKSLLPAICAHVLVNLTGASALLPFHAVAACIAIYIIHGVLLCRSLCPNQKEKQL